MVVVLICAAQWKLVPIISKMDGFYKIKTNMGNVFFYVDTDEKYPEVERKMRRQIQEVAGEGYVYDIKPIFNGKVDLSSNMSDEEKMNQIYFTNTIKDISDDEIMIFCRTKGIGPFKGMEPVKAQKKKPFLRIVKK